MIKSVHIKNFQRHTDSTLEFSPGFNVITGTSNHGKSSIVRALRWAILNKPSSGFKNWYSKNNDSMFVKVEFDNGWVKRYKKGIENSYSGQENGKEVFHLKALRTDVPDEIKSITRMNEINIQGQYEKFYFLHDITPGQIGKKISETVDLEIIDAVRVTANSELDKITNRIKIAEKEQEELIPQLAELQNLDEIEKLIRRIEVKMGREKELNEKIKKVSFLKEEIVGFKKDKKKADQWFEIKKPYEKIKKRIFFIKTEISPKLKKIAILKNELKELKEKKKESDKKYPNKKTIQTLIQKINTYNNLDLQYNEIKKLCDDIKKKRSLKLEADRAWKNMKKERKELQNSLDICPFCGKEM